MGIKRTETERIDAALEAVRKALRALNESSDKLRGARAMSEMDAVGGGWWSSLIKRDQVDRADLSLRSVDLELAEVRRLLGDVGVEEVGGLGIGPVGRTMDVWFDNLVTDLMTHRRIKKSQARVDALGRALVRVQSELGRRRAELETETGPGC